MRRTILGVMTLLAVVSLYGCNTMKGLGKDLSVVGGWITNGSEHVEESIGKNPPGSKMDQ